jgi:hypothetical protein
MKLYQFYIWDAPELFHHEAETLAQAKAEICENFEIEPEQIESIQEVTA